jgi:hypothetical protein
MAIFASGATRLYRIIQSPNVMALLYELGGFRQIYTDGRPLPKDPNPTWMGYSVGHWEGDTLVVESAGFNDKTWLDMVGHPHSEQLRVTERFHRVDFGHIQVQVTYDDAETLTKPLTVSLGLNYAADTDLLEYVCNENEKDTSHLVGTAKVVAQLPASTLARYGGVYKYREGPPAAATFFGTTDRQREPGTTIYEGLSSRSANRDPVRFDCWDDRVLPGCQRQDHASHSERG